MRVSSPWMMVLCIGVSCAEVPAGNDLTNRRDPYATLVERPAWPKALDLTVPAGDHRLVVKFVDTARVRVIDDALTSTLGADLGPVLGLEREKNIDIDYRPLVVLDEVIVEAIEREAAANTGVRPIDLRSMFVVDAPRDRLEEIGEALAALDVVEWAEFELLRPEPPACTDLAPVSALLTSEQDYTAFFDGFNTDNARAQYPNARGAGVKIADVEYGANGDHEDLCGIVFEPGQTIPSWVYDNGWDSHGTAVMGILLATDNAYGVTGLAPDADGYFHPEWSNQQGSRRASAITSAAGAVGPGGIIVLEMQTIVYGNDYGPAELTSSVWSAVKNAVDAGRVVIAAAGNGDQNLDGAAYAPYMARGDSGAIIVGAGEPGGSPDKLYYSTYGSRVNVQGWGWQVASTGYGGLATFGGDKNQRYTATFSGTSSATPCVAGVAAIVQGYAQATYGESLTSQQMRQLLIDSGIPQGSGGNIGPRPDAVAALAMVDEMFDLFCDADFNQDGEVNLGDFGIFGPAFGSSPGMSNWDPRADFDLDGDVDLADFGAFGVQFGLTSDGCRAL
ncbi:MAG: hypothetical protein Tsb0013_18850 [Phycisphaerales bacterium]